MLREPTCSTSAYCATRSTSRGSITSVTTGRPVRSRASARISSPRSPQPLEAIGIGARLEGAATEHVPARVADHAGDIQGLLPALHGARPGHDDRSLAPHHDRPHGHRSDLGLAVTVRSRPAQDLHGRGGSRGFGSTGRRVVASGIVVRGHDFRGSFSTMAMASISTRRSSRQSRAWMPVLAGNGSRL